MLDGIILKKFRDTIIRWNTLDNTNFYFVHSYYFKALREENIAAVTPYCGEFPSIVVKDNIVGTQFHPEKSQKAGFKVIKNFLRM